LHTRPIQFDSASPIAPRGIDQLTSLAVELEALNETMKKHLVANT
jgi:hypothetical protein